MSDEVQWVRELWMPFKAYRCPCCRFKTLEERGGDDICPICFWHDDGQDEPDADRVLGAPSGKLSLTQARENFRRFGVIEERFRSKVRPPMPGEI